MESMCTRTNTGDKDQGEEKVCKYGLMSSQPFDQTKIHLEKQRRVHINECVGVCVGAIFFASKDHKGCQDTHFGESFIGV